MIRVSLLNEYGKVDIPERKIKEIIKFVLKEMEKDNSELSLVLCNNDYIHFYNKEYRNKDYPTDVLSFVDGERIGKITYLGDIIISIDKVKSQSEEYGVSFEEEFSRLLVHGILHLLGYDHETSEEDEKVMMSIQDKLVDEVLRKFFGS
jgi:probable rRNA maturation factor